MKTCINLWLSTAAIAIVSLLASETRVVAQENITYYFCDFSEGIPTEVQTFDIDNQTLHYTMIQAGFKQGLGWIAKKEEKNANRYAASACRYKDIEGSELYPSDDWLITPPVWIRSDDACLTWQGVSFSQQTSSAAAYKVIVSAEAETPGEFTEDPIFETEAESVNVWTEHSVSLSEFAGQRVRIAFVSCGTEGEILGIDDIRISGSKGICDLKVDAPRYIFGSNTLTMDIVLEACSEERITDVEIHCVCNGKEKIVKSEGLSLSYGESTDFDIILPVDVGYGETLDYEVWALVNSVITTDPIAMQVCALMFEPHKNIAVEEGTGMWCTYCPSGIVAMDILEEKYPDRFIGLALHYNDPLGVDEYFNDLTFTNGIPSGWINRKHYSSPMVEVSDESGSYYTTLEGGFETHFIEEMQIPAIADVVLSSDIVGSTVEANSNVRFATDIDGANYQIAYVVTENDVMGDGYYQVNGYSGSSVAMGGFESKPEVIHDMEFQHVVRAIYDSWQGVTNSVPEYIKGGEIYTHSFSFQLPQSVTSIDNTEIIALLIDLTTGEIVNSAKAPISSGVEMMSCSDSIFDCYTSQSCIGIRIETCMYDDCHVTIYDVSGRQVDSIRIYDRKSVFSRPLPSGIYIVVLHDGNSSITRKVAVQ